MSAEMCAGARGPYFTSAYRCGACPRCVTEGQAERLSEHLCGFYCDCMPDYFDRGAAQTVDAWIDAAMGAA
jgi:hypothetical protein